MKTTHFNHHLRPARFAVLAVLMFTTFVSAVIPAAAQDAGARRPITLARLKGSWQAALVLNGGCGVGSKVVNFTLNKTGTGAATWTGNTAACGQETGTGTVTITSLKANGSGTATFSLNFVANFDIQVSPSGQVFNMVEVADSGNYDVGSSVKQ